MKRKRCLVALIVVLSLLFNGVFEISSYATALDDDGEKGFFDSSIVILFISKPPCLYIIQYYISFTIVSFTKS